ncbi:hypothetical protein PIB30_031568 [Stylosanthes scabra]|uniref:Uncharacterized protein n=1 Tax=Stylosanthes scabra TaxID=79078 RepID=A0ABU6RC31_9FABA|nr:hypothetical protein [Stylosanthes scabra]
MDCRLGCILCGPEHKVVAAAETFEANRVSADELHMEPEDIVPVNEEVTSEETPSDVVPVNEEVESEETPSDDTRDII